MRRAGTIVRSPLDMRTKDKDKDKGKPGELRGYEVPLLFQPEPLTQCSCRPSARFWIKYRLLLTERKNSCQTFSRSMRLEKRLRTI
jgi:hypothetical protein